MEWLLEQAKNASPFVAVFCLAVLGSAVTVLWRQHLRDVKTYVALAEEQTRATLANARAAAKLATKLDGIKRRR